MPPPSRVGRLVGPGRQCKEVPSRELLSLGASLIHHNVKCLNVLNAFFIIMLINDKIVTIQGHFFLIIPMLSMFLTSTCYFWSLEYWVKDLRLALYN